MRLNKYLAASTNLSRRAADQAIADGRVMINGFRAVTGIPVSDNDIVELDGSRVTPRSTFTTIILNKPEGYVCSREGQGSLTVYELLPPELHHLKPVGRLDKDSSGLLLLTDDGQMANELTHPSHQKIKRYTTVLDRELSATDAKKISTEGVELEDGLSRLQLAPAGNGGREWQVVMTEGRNRQIRRTFKAIGYEVRRLRRTEFGPYSLGTLQSGTWQTVEPE